MQSVFVVKHRSRSAGGNGLPIQDESTRYIFDLCSRIEYTWPTNSCTRAKHPPLQPSDVVAAISPNDSSSRIRLLLVHRFAVAIVEKSRFIILFDCIEDHVNERVSSTPEEIKEKLIPIVRN